MQFERRTPGSQLFPLPLPSDRHVGAGLERVTSVVQNVRGNYDTDLFAPILAEERRSAQARPTAPTPRPIRPLRVIADHARCSAFLIADGVFPDKTGREYVLRRIFRRAVRHGKLLGITEPFMHDVCARVIAEMGGAYPDLVDRRATIANVALEEEKRFRATLDRGLALLDDEFARMTAAGEKRVSGQGDVHALRHVRVSRSDLTRRSSPSRTVESASIAGGLRRSRWTSSASGATSRAPARWRSRPCSSRSADRKLKGDLRASSATMRPRLHGRGQVVALRSSDGRRAIARRQRGSSPRTSLVIDQGNAVLRRVRRPDGRRRRGRRPPMAAPARCVSTMR